MDSFHRLILPSQIEAKYELADLGSRLLAAALDIFFQILFLLGWYWILAMNRWFPSLSSLGWDGSTLFAWSGVVIVVVQWGYNAGFEGYWNGQTPGKRLTRLRTIRTDARPIGWNEAVVRNLLRPMEGTAFLAVLGLALIFVHPRRQRFGDLAARTLVIHEPRLEWTPWDLLPDRKNHPGASTLDLPLEEMQPLARYFAVRQQLPPSERAPQARLLRQRLLRSVGGNLPDPLLSDDRWLEELRNHL